MMKFCTQSEMQKIRLIWQNQAMNFIQHGSRMRRCSRGRAARRMCFSAKPSPASAPRGNTRRTDMSQQERPRTRFPGSDPCAARQHRLAAQYRIATSGRKSDREQAPRVPIIIDLGRVPVRRVVLVEHLALTHGCGRCSSSCTAGTGEGVCGAPPPLLSARTPGACCWPPVVVV